MPRNVLVFAAIIAALGMFLTLVWPEPEPSPVPSAAGAPAPEAPAPLAAAGGIAAPRPAAPVPSAAAETASTEEDKPAAPAPSGFKDLVESDQGPVAEYQHRYDSETRDSNAQSFETHIRSAFMQGSSSEVFHSVSCHETICRVLIRYSPSRTLAYVEAMKRVGVGGAKNPDAIGFDLPLALTPVGTKDGEGVRTVEVYMKRR